MHTRWQVTSEGDGNKPCLRVVTGKANWWRSPVEEWVGSSRRSGEGGALCAHPVGMRAAATCHDTFRDPWSLSRSSGLFFFTMFGPYFHLSMHMAFLSLPVDEELIQGHDLTEKKVTGFKGLLGSYTGWTGCMGEILCELCFGISPSGTVPGCFLEFFFPHSRFFPKSNNLYIIKAIRMAIMVPTWFFPLKDYIILKCKITKRPICALPLTM